jgi:hypothetical protein
VPEGLGTPACNRLLRHFPHAFEPKPPEPRLRMCSYFVLRRNARGERQGLAAGCGTVPERCRPNEGDFDWDNRHGNTGKAAVFSLRSAFPLVRSPGKARRGGSETVSQ